MDEIFKEKSFNVINVMKKRVKLCLHTFEMCTKTSAS